MVRNIQGRQNLTKGLLQVYTQSYAGLTPYLNCENEFLLFHKQYNDAIPSPMQPLKAHFLKPPVI